MYYRLVADLNLNAGMIMADDNVGETLITGLPLTASELVLPWPFLLEHDGPDPLQLADFYPNAGLMSIPMIDTLKAAGVDNLQIFDARITNSSNGKKIPGYKVVNIIGLISAADKAASKSRPLAHVRFFEKLVLDEKRTGGQLMFRLAESLIDIIVAEPVAKAIKAKDFPDVVLEPLGRKPR
jgi:hypothetical protein